MPIKERDFMNCESEYPIVLQCCICKRHYSDGQWRDIEPEEESLVSHSYCPNCAQQVFWQLGQEKLQPRLKAKGAPQRQPHCC